MEKKNLVARVPSEEDHRINLIFLTKNGEQKLKETWPIMKQIVLDIQNGISTKDIHATIKVMKKMLLNLNLEKNIAPETK